MGLILFWAIVGSKTSPQVRHRHPVKFNSPVSYSRSSKTSYTMIPDSVHSPLHADYREAGREPLLGSLPLSQTRDALKATARAPPGGCRSAPRPGSAPPPCPTC